MRLDIIPERPCLPVGEVTSLPVLIRLTAPTVPQMARKPLNLCLVIDRSGSMANEKLRHTIASAKFVVERLAATDLLSVVQFDERVKVVIPPGPVTDRAHLCRRLDGIHAGGQTNLSGGWLRGAACVRERQAPDYINRVILLTDGQANHGITDPAVLVKHAAELTEEGITTTTIGYGEDFNEDLLTALADAGRGNAYHVETADQAPTIFARELEGLLAIAAQNVRVTFTPSGLVRRVDLCSTDGAPPGGEDPHRHRGRSRQRGHPVPASHPPDRSRDRRRGGRIWGRSPSPTTTWSGGFVPRPSPTRSSSERSPPRKSRPSRRMPRWAKNCSSSVPRKSSRLPSPRQMLAT